MYGIRGPRIEPDKQLSSKSHRSLRKEDLPAEFYIVEPDTESRVINEFFPMG